ncbi:DHH family phosphoesterase [Candidatus Woesearchaeota archaeon]|nr:DHH family phosphoesterase [Candidatus Woesearchaeota archaeon]
MLNSREISQIQKIVDDTLRPIIFFDDDPDGLSSFLLFYKKIQDGDWIAVKGTPELSADFAEKAESDSPDRIIVLDKPGIAQDFLDSVKTPILWVDHHEIQTPKGNSKIDYFNPRRTKTGFGEPTSYCSYKITNNPNHLWIAMIGCVGDWFLPDREMITEFCKKYPTLLDENVDTPQKALYESKLGELVQVFSFIMKGKISEIKRNIKYLLSVKNPFEILEKRTPEGKAIYKFYKACKKEYDFLLDLALENVNDSKILFFSYKETNNSYTSDISNELLYRFPDKVILIAREKSGEMRMSLRSAKISIAPILSKALEGIDGYGGGHEFACGCNVKKKDFPQFMDNLKELIENGKKK